MVQACQCMTAATHRPHEYLSALCFVVLSYLLIVIYRAVVCFKHILTVSS
jgi:hypothetical protein